MPSFFFTVVLYTVNTDRSKVALLACFFKSAFNSSFTSLPCGHLLGNIYMLEFVDVAAVVHFWFGLGIQLYRFIHIVLGKRGL